MGNEEERCLKIDLINFDMEEIKINRELYNIQMQINAKLAKDKKIKLKKNYKQFAQKKLRALEEKKRLLFEREEYTKNKENNKEIKNKNIFNNAGDKVVNIEKSKNKDDDKKLSLISNGSKGNKNNLNKFISEEIGKMNNKNREKKELISNSENSNELQIKTIYTKKKSKLSKDNIEELLKNNDIEKNKDKDNDRYDKIKNENDFDNLNINKYKRLFFDKLSSMGPRSNFNKSMDNKNSSIVEELEVVGLSQNEILKDKLSEFFVGTSVESSSIQNKNYSSLHNNYYKNRAKSEISGMNRQLISSSKDNEQKNEINNSTSYNNINYEPNFNGNLEVFEGNKNVKGFHTGGSGEKNETEETFNKKSGNYTEEKYKIDNQKINIEEKKLLKNNRNKSFYVLDDSYLNDNSLIKESRNLD